MLSKRTETTASADDGNGLSRAHTRLLDALVDGDTSAEDWCYALQRDVLRESSHVGGLGDSILLEGTINGVS